jgi:TolA-binding protein
MSAIMGGLIVDQTSKRIRELEERVTELEKEFEHFQRKLGLLISHMEHSDNLTQSHEHGLWRLEHRFPEDDHK